MLFIQLFFCALYLHGIFCTPEKHQGLADFPITNIGSFSPSAFAAAIPVNQILLCFPPTHFLDLSGVTSQGEPDRIARTHQCYVSQVE